MVAAIVAWQPKHALRCSGLSGRPNASLWAGSPCGQSRGFLSCPGVISSRGVFARYDNRCSMPAGSRLGRFASNRHERNAMFARAQGVLKNQRLGPIFGRAVNDKSFVSELIRPSDVRISGVAHRLAV